jgi:hypothetical protein
LPHELGGGHGSFIGYILPHYCPVVLVASYCKAMKHRDLELK